MSALSWRQAASPRAAASTRMISSGAWVWPAAAASACFNSGRPMVRQMMETSGDCGSFVSLAMATCFRPPGSLRRRLVSFGLGGFQMQCEHGTHDLGNKIEEERFHVDGEVVGRALAERQQREWLAAGDDRAQRR